MDRSIEWIKSSIARDRDRAGVTAERYDPATARASLPDCTLDLPEGIRISQERINGVLCFRVQAAQASQHHCIVYLHGGGFIAGGFHSHRSLVCWLSEYSGATILFPEYRLAPEHRFPAGVDDCFAVYAAARREGYRSLFVIGDSAGGALANAVLLKARDMGAGMPDGAAILCGMMDLSEDTSAFLKLTQRTRDGVRLYVSHLKDLESPLASAMLSDPAGFPPMLIQTGTEDYCAEDTEAYAKLVRSVGVDATFENWPGMIHVWHRFAPDLPEARKALKRIAEWMDGIAPR